MQSQVTLRSEKGSLAGVYPVSRIAIAAALSFTSALIATIGCGSGTLQSLGSGSGSQSSAVPTASAQGPQLGYLWLDSDRTLRPILGVAGASQIGQSLVPAGTYVGAASNAAANIAILQDAEGNFDLMRLPSGSPASLSVQLPASATIRISPSATSALLYSPGSSTATLITNLLSTPQSQSLKLAGAIVDSAVSDTGTVAAEYTQGSALSLSVIPVSGRAVPLATVGAAGGLSFLPGREDLLYADGAANSASLVRSTSSAPASSLVQTGSILKSPTALGVSGNGRWALVVNKSASSATQTLARIDLTTLTTVQVTCSCRPTEAAVLTDEGAFRVTNVKSGANWIVDASATSPRTLFIPALPQAAKTSLVAANITP